jgi:hypothetical protein
LDYSSRVANHTNRADAYGRDARVFRRLDDAGPALRRESIGVRPRTGNCIACRPLMLLMASNAILSDLLQVSRTRSNLPFSLAVELRELRFAALRPRACHAVQCNRWAHLHEPISVACKGKQETWLVPHPDRPSLENPACASAGNGRLIA